MRQTGFGEGVVLAFGFALFSVTVFPIVFGGLFVLSNAHLMIAFLSSLYGFYLLYSSGKRTGTLTVLCLWVTSLVIIWTSGTPANSFLLMHLAALCVLRSLLFHPSLAGLFLDACLQLCAAFCSFWSLHRTGSVFLSVWSFFLVQATFYRIRHLLPGRSATRKELSLETSENRFNSAQRDAEAALNKLNA